jgi:NADPH:quinone reductase-like Zn-dependent oxidoreductase
VIGFASGQIPKIEANRILLKNIAVVGLHWPPYREHEPERFEACLTALENLCETGALQPRVSTRYPLESVADALAALGARGTWGKIVLLP